MNFLSLGIASCVFSKNYKTAERKITLFFALFLQHKNLEWIFSAQHESLIVVVAILFITFLSLLYYFNFAFFQFCSWKIRIHGCCGFLHCAATVECRWLSNGFVASKAAFRSEIPAMQILLEFLIFRSRFIKMKFMDLSQENFISDTRYRIETCVVSGIIYRWRQLSIQQGQASPEG